MQMSTITTLSIRVPSVLIRGYRFDAGRSEDC